MSDLPKRRIALCLSGGISHKTSDFQGGYTHTYANHTCLNHQEDLSAFVDYRACYQSIKKHIIDCNTDWQVDVYIHMWQQNAQLTEDLLRLYRPARHVFEPNHSVMSEIEAKCQSFGDSSCRYKGNLSRLYSVCHSVKLALTSPIAYDLVISYRPDMLLWKDMDFSRYSPHAITKNGSSFGDFHFVMSQANARLFSELYTKVNSELYHSGFHVYSKFVTAYLKLPLHGDDIEPNRHQEVLRKLRKHTLRLNHISDATLIAFGLCKEDVLQYD